MNIVLSGFMGSGKSTIAKLLAKRLNKEYIDLDEYISKMTGLRIVEIFDKYGEKGFRKYENQAVAKISEDDNFVIATGGGTILDPVNGALLKNNGTIVFLDVSIETVLKRLINDNTRPLLNSTDKAKAITDLLETRLPIYKSSADIIIDANSDNIQQKVMDIIKQLYNFKKS